MTLEAWVGVLALLVATLAAIAEFLRQAGPWVRFQRWVRVLADAQNEQQKMIARERIQFYVIELAVADRTRLKRRESYVAGFLLLLLGTLVTTMGIVLLGQTAALLVALGYVATTVGAGSYVVGLWSWLNRPDNLTDSARRAIRAEVDRTDRERGAEPNRVDSPLSRLFRRQRR